MRLFSLLILLARQMYFSLLFGFGCCFIAHFYSPFPCRMAVGITLTIHWKSTKQRPSHLRERTTTTKFISILKNHDRNTVHHRKICACFISFESLKTLMCVCVCKCINIYCCLSHFEKWCAAYCIYKYILFMYCRNRFSLFRDLIYK